MAKAGQLKWGLPVVVAGLAHTVSHMTGTRKQRWDGKQGQTVTLLVPVKVPQFPSMVTVTEEPVGAFQAQTTDKSRYFMSP